MAKKRFHISPKLNEDKPSTPKKVLPIQKISPEEIEKIALPKSDKKENRVAVEKTVKTKNTKKTKEAKSIQQKSDAKQQAKRPQGRPRREEPVKRLSSDLPADLYDQVKAEVKDNGYTLNGFLAKVLRSYFKNKKED